MWDILDKMIIIPIIGAFAYGFVRQIRETRILLNSNNWKNKAVRGNVMASISYGVFLMSFILNTIMVFTKSIDRMLISQYTSALCTVALVIFFISKYNVSDKN